MTKEDKQFFTDLIRHEIGEVNLRIDGLDQKMTEMGKELRLEMAEMGKGLRLEMAERGTKLSDGIRYNGILIEQLDEDLRTLANNVCDFNRQMSAVRVDIDRIKEEVDYIPAIRTVIKNHSKKLAELSR